MSTEHSKRIGRPPVPASQRFWPKVNKDGPIPERAPHLGNCWLWIAGRITDAYGSQYGWFRGESGRGGVAHRWSYEDEHGPIPDGAVLDHLCCVKLCVRPSHLEPVTVKENLLRGDTPAARNLAKTHCPLGHPYDGFCPRQRYCKRCKTISRAAFKARRLAAAEQCQ